MISNIQKQKQVYYSNAQGKTPEFSSASKLPKGIQPDMKDKVQNATKEAQDSVKESAGMQMLTSMMDGMDPYSPKTWGVIGGFWAAFAGLNDLLNLNLHNTWDKTIFGKFGALGDSIQTALMKHGAPRILNPAKRIIGFIKDKLPFLTTPMNPENAMARSQAGGIFFQVSSGMNGILNKYISKTPEGYKHLFTDAKNAEQAKEWLDQISRDPKLYADKLDDLITNLTNNRDAIGKKGQEALNKYISVGQKYIKNPQNKTWLGKKLATMPTSVMEFATNGTAAGKVFIGIQALIFAQALFKAIKAPKGEKKATFMENVMGDFVYAAAMPVMLMPANILGGLKYVGMGKGVAARQAAVKNYREVLHSLNTLIKEGKLEGKALIDNNIIRSAEDIVIGADGKVQGIELIAEKGKKVLKDLLYKDAKWYHKPFKKIGELFSMGLESVKGSGFLKGKIGGALRLIIAMAVVAPIIGKLGRGLSHKLFGKPTSAIKEEEEARAKKAEKKAQKAQKRANREAMRNIDPKVLEARLEAHPEITNELQNNPELMAEIQKNPMLLIQMLDEADKHPSNTSTEQASKPKFSPALQTIINQRDQKPIQAPTSQNGTLQTQMNQVQTNNNVEPPVKSPIELNAPVKNPIEAPERSYIPSSAPVQKSALDKQHDLKMNLALTHADEAERFALDCIGV